MLLLTAAQKISIRASDERKFPPLMLMIYFSIDYFQTSLYTTANVLSADFWIMICIGEISSLAKNTGLLQYLMWCVCLRKTNPYSDEEFVYILRSKGVVDSLSELLVGFTAFFHYMFEVEAREWPGIDIYNVTYADLKSNTTSFFLTERCSITCMGYNVADGIPPPPVSSLRSRWVMLGVFSLIALIRVGFLFSETSLVNNMEASANKTKKSSVMPEADGGNSEGKGASVSVPSNDDAAVDGNDEADGDADKVETKGDRVKDKVKRHTSEVANNMAGLVFKDVSALFLLVSFVMAMNSCWWGLQILTLAPADEGTEVHLVAG